MTMVYRFAGIICCLFIVLAATPPSARADHAGATIRVGIFPFEPINFVDETGQARGLYPDLLRQIARQHDWTLEFVPGSWAEGLERLQNEAIDLMVSVAYTPQRAESMDFTHESVLELWGQVFIRPDGEIRNINDLAGRRVGIMRKDISGANFIATADKFAVDCEILEFTSHAEVFAAVRDGTVAAGVAPQHFGLRHVREYELVPSTIQFSPFSIYLAVKKGKRFDILSTIDRQLIRWKQDQDSFYYQRLAFWLGPRAEQLPVIPRWIGWTLGAIGCAVILLLVIIRTLKAQINKHSGELRASEKRFRRAILDAPFPIMLHAEDGEVLTVNNTWSTLSGYGQDDIPTTASWAERAYGEQATSVLDNLKTIYTGNGPVDENEYPLTTRDGESLTWAFSSSPLGRLADGRLGAITMAMDITRRKQMEENLREVNALNESLLRTIPFPIDIVSLEGRVLFSNALFEQTLGKQTKRDLCWARSNNDGRPCPGCPLTGEVRIGATSSLECSGPLDGRDYEIFQTGMLYQGQTALMEVFFDITERKRMFEERSKLEQQMLHAQKLESLGVLAGGIAHDFNNLLMAIMGNAELARARLAAESPARPNLQQIEAAAHKAADLAGQMLAYSGRGKFVVESLDLSRIVEEMLHMLEVSISKKAVLRCELAPNLPLIDADATQLRQIIMNLVINASDAVGDRSGVIAVTTGAMDCDRGYLRDVWLDEKLPEGLYVYFEVADTGCGMDRDTVSRIFDPFYSTKFTGRGLGLAAVLGIVRGHRGAIKVYTEERRGTTFKVLFPASARLVEPLIQQPPDERPLSGGGTVLLVDDEETVRGIGKTMLQELGFEVLVAADGREGLAMFRQHRTQVSFVLMDLTMPHLDGEETFREMRRIEPQVKVILSSGYNEQEVSQKFAGKGLAGFLKKPYTLVALREAVRKATH